MTAATYSRPPAAPPRLRGSLHYWSFFVSLATSAVLITFAASTVSGTAALATSVYGATVLGLFGISALYHRRTWVSTRSRLRMKRLDHSMIFVLIAGTYTPFSLLAMGRPDGYV
ncbi:MAG: hemolysin III family protein, partial [Sciscionella sp.]